MTSLQREEFFELVATAQARRLDDQRALLSLPLPKSRTRSLRGSIKQLSFVRRPAPAPAPNPTPAPVPKEDLYNMILTTQVSRFMSRGFVSDSERAKDYKDNTLGTVSGINVSCPLNLRPRAGWRTSAAELPVPWMMRTSSHCS